MPRPSGAAGRSGSGAQLVIVAHKVTGLSGRGASLIAVAASERLPAVVEPDQTIPCLCATMPLCYRIALPQSGLVVK